MLPVMLACPNHPVVVLEKLTDGFFCMVCDQFVEPAEVEDPASKVIAFRPKLSTPPPSPPPRARPSRKTLEPWIEALSKDPNDVRVLQKLGELHQKLGEPTEAAEYFARVGAQFERDGYFLKAVAVYKQVLKLQESPAVRFKLAEVYRQLGLMSDAMTELGHIAKLLEVQGDADALGDILRKMAALDPDNVASRIKLAELYVREKDPRAVDEFVRAAEYLERNQRWDDLLKVANRIRFLAPEREDTHELVARVRARFGLK